MLEMTERGLYAVRFPGQFRNKKGQAISACLSPLLNKLRNMKLDLTGYTPFQLQIYAALRKVPVGQTVTYGELARRAGYPGAARAVGSAMKRNRLPVVIPCHRVIKEDGSLGQYSPGVHWKRRLLEYEKQHTGDTHYSDKNECPRFFR